MKVLLAIMIVLLAGCAKKEGAQASGGSAPAAQPQSITGTATCPPEFQSAQFIIPCKTTVSGMPQILAKNGANVFAVTKMGSNVSYTLLAPGSYVSTDGRSCNFTVNSDGSISE